MNIGEGEIKSETQLRKPTSTMDVDIGGNDISFDSDIPLEQWGRTQVLTTLMNRMNPTNEPNERVTQFINALLNHGYDHGEALSNLTKEDLDELFPNLYYQGYKKTLLKYVESLNPQISTKQSSSTIPGEPFHYTQKVKSVYGINSQRIDGPVYFAENTHHSQKH